jgi:hypothetical protein
LTLMRVCALRAPSVLAGTLIVLFFVLSFNAYACLLPVNGATANAMGNGCSTPDEQPVSQFCDTYKTLGVQSADKLLLNSDYQALCPEDTASLALLAILLSPSSYLSDHPTIGPPQDLLLKISVLRI